MKKKPTALDTACVELAEASAAVEGATVTKGKEYDRILRRWTEATQACTQAAIGRGREILKERAKQHG